jgi:hypothetical protein
MATTTTVSNISIAMSRPRITSSQKLGPAILGCRVKVGSCDKLGSVCHVASVKPFHQASTSRASKFEKLVTKAMSESSSNKQVTGLPIDLRGLTSFCVDPSYNCIYLAFVYMIVARVCVCLTLSFEDFFLMVSIVIFDLT